MSVDGARDEPTMIGVGASAGGLAALEALFGAASEEAPWAWLVAVHLDPDRHSLVPELLERVTPLTVMSAVDGIRVAAHHIYVIPPGATMSLDDGKIRLTQREGDLVIDALFRSLAAERGERAIGIVLSGTGTDGTRGLRAIRLAHGVTLAQDATAKQRGMPGSAIGAGVVDHVLAPEDMPAAVRKHLDHKASTPPSSRQPSPAFWEILAILKARTGHDFAHYKRTTIVRRCERRLAKHHLRRLEDYAELLRDSSDEPQALLQELLISVTSFFRDPESFEALRPWLEERLRSNPAGEPFRVWVPACSTGQEAYSIAMLLQEVAGELDVPAHFAIFATDIDERAIELARVGCYPESITRDVTRGRLRRFFTPHDDGGYRVTKALREMLVFASQSVIRDPPFSRLDLLSCRNLLIYLDAEMQRSLLRMFHYGLRPGGLLVLGASETIGRANDLFEPLVHKWKLFRRQPLNAGRHALFDIRSHAMPHAPTPTDKPTDDERGSKHALQLMKAVLRQGDAPPCAVIDASMTVVFVYGSTGAFLEPAEGTPTMNILNMARPSLRTALGTCVRTVLRSRRPVEQRGIKLSDHGEELVLDIVVRPVIDPPELADLTVVYFERQESVTAASEQLLNDGDDGEQVRLAELRREYFATKANLQSAIEELETANEELKSRNEELQSTNEELQSTNEELETSKEELQSLNEEGGTVNAELESRLERLMRANDDLSNLLISTGIATIFLDTELRVRRFTPAAEELFPLTAADEGRPLAHFASSLLDVDVERVVNAMLDDLVIREIEVRTRDGREFLMKVRPYKTTNNAIDGAVLTFEDQTALKRAAQAMVDELAGRHDETP